MKARLTPLEIEQAWSWAIKEAFVRQEPEPQVFARRVEAMVMERIQQAWADAAEQVKKDLAEHPPSHAGQWKAERLGKSPVAADAEDGMGGGSTTPDDAAASVGGTEQYAPQTDAGPGRAAANPARRPSDPSHEHQWGIDGAHTNEYCKVCFVSRAKDGMGGGVTATRAAADEESSCSSRPELLRGNPARRPSDPSDDSTREVMPTETHIRGAIPRNKGSATAALGVSGGGNAQACADCGWPSISPMKPSCARHTFSRNAQAVEGEIERLLEEAHARYPHAYGTCGELCRLRALAALARRLVKERDDMKAAWYAVSKEATELEEQRDQNAAMCDEARQLYEEAYHGVNMERGLMPPPWRPR